MEEISLLGVFTKAQDQFKETEDSEHPGKSEEFQNLVLNAIRSFVTSSIIVSKNSLFSDNEDLKEIAPSSLKYLSIQYYLGELYQKLHNNDIDRRINNVKLSMDNFEKFLKTCSNYNIYQHKESDGNPPELQRQEKIARFRREKEIQETLQKILREKLNAGIDEDLEEDTEFEKKTSLLLLESNAIKAVDTLSSIKQELEILNHMKIVNDQNKEMKKEPEPEPPKKAMQPLVITDTKQFIRDNAFLPGWNLPTVSIEEANEIDYREAVTREKRQKEAEKNKKTVKEFGDDDEEAEELQKTRDFDNFKDNNPKGSGNTGTKGYYY